MVSTCFEKQTKKDCESVYYCNYNFKEVPSSKIDTCTHKLYVSGKKDVVDACKGLDEAKCIENDFCIFNIKA